MPLCDKAAAEADYINFAPPLVTAGLCEAAAGADHQHALQAATAEHGCLRLQSSVKQRLGQAIDMNVSILTSGYWPSYPLYEARLPDELTRHQQVFKVGAASSCLQMLP